MSQVMEFSLFTNPQNDISYLLDDEAVLAANMMQMVSHLTGNPFKIQFNKPNTTEFMQRALQDGFTVRLKDENNNTISVASPGNSIELQEELNLPINQQSTIMVLYKDVGYYALIINSFTMQIGFFNFTDDDSFNNLQSFIIHNNVKEIVYHLVDEQLDRICTEYQVKLTRIAKSMYVISDDNRWPFEEQIKKCGGVCKSHLFVDLNEYNISEYNSNEFLKLDIYAIRALHVFNDFNDTNSIFGLFKCSTTMGTRLLNNWLQCPLNDHTVIQTRLDIVEHFKSTNLQCLQLKQFPDIAKFARKLLKKSITLSELWSIKDIIDTCHALVRSLDYFDQVIQHYFKSQLTELLKETHQFYECIVDNILYDPTLHVYKVRPESLESLSSINTEINEITRSMDSLFTKIRHSTSDKLTLDKHIKHGYCLRIPKSKAGLVKKYKNIIELATLKNQVYFTTLELQHYSSQLKSLQSQYNKASIEITDEIHELGVQYAQCYFNISELIAQIDVLSAFANTATLFNYNRPVFGNELIIKEGRHPCIEQQNNMTFISNDCHMSVDNSVEIVTGFNTGGKSTYLRMVGVVCLMAHVGSLVPCSFCTVPLLDGIFCRVGAGDSLIRGKSTFYNEMLEASSIIKTATSRSLVLIDELGRGTSNADGFGLAWAILEHLSEIRCITIFATHFHELSRLGEVNENIKCKQVAMEIVDGDIVPCYKVIDGASCESYGIKVAKIAGFNSEVIKMAEEMQEQLMR
eukprot:NODE_522_length_7276_cov_0.315173.p1 type:complete len:746 gc:universal NODE_522_length_7276_cov_0.315173:6003-3766(-)